MNISPKPVVPSLRLLPFRFDRLIPTILFGGGFPLTLRVQSYSSPEASSQSVWSYYFFQGKYQNSGQSSPFLTHSFFGRNKFFERQNILTGNQVKARLVAVPSESSSCFHSSCLFAADSVLLEWFRRQQGNTGVLLSITTVCTYEKESNTGSVFDALSE